MAKPKKIECFIIRWMATPEYYSVHLGDLEIASYDKKFRKICPVLIKGLRPGESRELILTQTKNGIKLERAKP